MNLLKIELSGAFSRTLEFGTSAPAEPRISVVTGANGSGKTLMTMAIMTALGDERAWENLAGAGVERITVDFGEDDRRGQIVCDVAARTREIRWEAVTAEDAVSGWPYGRPGLSRHLRGGRLSGTDLTGKELLRLTNVVLSGQLTLPQKAVLQRAVLDVIRGPLEKELAGWKARQEELSGPAGENGRMAAAHAELEEAEREAARVEALWRQLEAERSRQEELTARLVETRSGGEVLRVEVEELDRLCAVAERAARLESWIEEIRGESGEVAELRRQHAQLQSRLDALEKRFRGAPDDLAGILRDYESVRARERAAGMKLVELRAERARQQAELESLRNEAAALRPPGEEDAAHLQDKLRGEIEAADSELTELLRARIELIRQREGLRQQVARDFPVMAALTEDERTRLREILAPSEIPAPLVEPHDESAEQERRKQIASLQAAIHERFAGFEKLRPAVPELLRELQDARRIFKTLSGDLDGLRNRIAMLKRKAHTMQSILWSAGAGGTGFAATTALSSWDIGIFAGLTASGLALLVFRYVRRGTEMELESATAAEAMISRRVEETRAARAKLEESLGPLAAAPSTELALRRYQEFVRLREQFAELESAPASAAPQMEKQEPVAQMPAALRGTPLPVLRQAWGTFVDLESRLVKLDGHWAEFEPEGSQAQRMRALEEKIENLRAEHSSLLAALQARRREHETRAAELSSRIAELESAPDGEEITRVEGELSVIREQMAALEAASGGLLREFDPDALSVEWGERETLRAQLRETRTKLSAKQTQDELRAREALLAEELAEMRQKLGALDPLYLFEGTGADYATKYAGQLRAARSSLRENGEHVQELEQELQSVNTEELETALNKEPPVEELQAAVTAARERLESVERDLMTTRELIALISDEIKEKEDSIDSDLSTALDRRLRALTEGTCLAMEERMGSWFVDGTEGPRKIETLSDGMRDLIAIALRLAVFDLVAEADSSPVVWDEALWRLDEANLARVREPLLHLAETRQVILFTRFAAIESWGTPLRLESAISTQTSRVLT